MKILVFEYITGGGYSHETLPPTLAREGELMAQALVGDLLAIPDIEVYLTRDWRLTENLFSTEKINLIRVHKNQDIISLLYREAARMDAVWPIAPESNQLLQRICSVIAATKKLLLSSPAGVVATTADKLLTVRKLDSYGIPVVRTERLLEANRFLQQNCVIKPLDGAGCENSYLIDQKTDLEQFIAKIDNPAGFVIQPYISGQSISLSCLFRKGRAWLLCYNRQQVQIVNQQFCLKSCIVNIGNEKQLRFQQLLDDIALVFPELWGYVGIDLMTTEGEPLVLEINPRLTTSYAGLREALGINVAENVLQLTVGEPKINAVRNKPVNLDITAGIAYDS